MKERSEKDMELGNSTMSILNAKRFPQWVLALALSCALAISADDVSARKAPEYMRLKYVPGIALEIKGDWDTSGVFIATDIEQLPNPRSPKLRGSIQNIDASARTVTVFGRRIHITKSTRYVTLDSDDVSFASLEIGKHIEVSCKVRDSGVWKARKIKTKHVKSSDKIKGSITRVAVDGVAPDTLELHGLLIILNKKTDINWPRGEIEKIEYDRFKYAALKDPESATSGVVITDNLLLTAKYRSEVEDVSEHDLTTTFATDVSDVQPGVRAELTAFVNDNISALTQIRWRKRYALSTDSQAILSEARQLDITQLYVLFRNIGSSPVALQIGRQDFDEPREWLFDEYLDAIRIHYIASKGFVAQAALIVSVAPIKQKFEPWTDYFAQIGWRFDRHSVANAYVLKRNDTSIRNREPIWWGLRYFGRPLRSLRSWVDVAILRGQDKGRSQDAWAFDVGTTYLLNSIGAVRPNVTFGYAIGSGNDNVNSGPNKSQEFRQSSYQDNYGKIGGSSQVRYYGEALRPELSNIKILTVGLGVIHNNESSLEALYHSYRQHRLEADLTKSSLVFPAQPLGASTDLGWGFDFLASSPTLWSRFRLRYTFSVFEPGEAFAPRNETALLNRLNLDVTL